MSDQTTAGGFGIYIHWPFCLSKCPYCDFNSHVTTSVDQRDWARALVLELERYAWITSERLVTSIFFGGGTPSLMEPALIETLLTCIAENWSLAKNVEITLEANPTSVEVNKFRDFRASGINRVSVGIQALNDGSLRQLGRLHTTSEALAAIDIAQSVFRRSNFDLIYARQDQNLSDWEAELGFALGLGSEHISLYQLTIEQKTAFGRLQSAGGLTGMPDDTLSADMYSLTQDLCEQAGLPAYEVSNHAKPWAQSRHNLVYWRCGDYIGVGPGAHGRVFLQGQRFAIDTPLSPDRWKSAAFSGNAEQSRTVLTAQDMAAEYVMMSLRLVEGLDLDRLSFFGGSINTLKIKELSEYGLLVHRGNRLIATPSGRMVLNAIIRQLLVD